MLIGLILSDASLYAATLYWDVNGTTTGAASGGVATGTWSTGGGSWNTDSTGLGGGTFTLSTTAADDLFFSAGTDATGSSTITISGGVSANSLTFNYGTISLSGTASPVLTLGPGGTTTNSTVAGTVSFGSTMTSIVLSGSQSWQNHSASLFSTSSSTAITGNATAGNTYILTLSGTGSGGQTLSGVIGNGSGGGALGLLVNGSGIVTLAGSANTFTGGVNVAGGTLSISSSGALGAAPGTATAGLVVLDGGTLQTTSSLTIDSNQGIALGPTTGSGTGTFDVSSGTTLTYGGTLADNGGTGSLLKLSSGHLLLTGTSTYTGTTTVSDGYLDLRTRTSLYNANTASWTASNLVVASGAYVKFNVGGTGEFTSADLDLLLGLGSATGGFKSGSFVQLDATNATGSAFTYASDIANPNGGANTLGVEIYGGTVTLSGSNSYTGVTKLYSTLGLGSANTLGGGGNIDFAGGTLKFSASNTSDYAARIKNSSYRIRIDTNGQNVVFAGTIDSTNSGGLQKFGTGSLTLSGSNTFTGNVNVGEQGSSLASGSLVLTNSNALGTSKTVTIANQSSGALVFDGSGGSVVLPTSISVKTSGGPSLINLAGNNAITGAVTLTSGNGGSTWQSNAGTLTISGAITPDTTGRTLTIQGTGGGEISGVISEAYTFQMPVTKGGNGVWRLSGANTYSGITTVSTGTLRIGNANALGIGGFSIGTGYTTVSSGAVLDLDGTTGISEPLRLTGTGISSGGALINSNTSTTATLVTGIADSTITSGGTYTSVPTLTAGTGAATATAGMGVTLTGATLSAGTGYTSAPTVSVTGGGSPNQAAVITATASGGTLSFTVTKAGAGYTSIPTVTISGGGGSGGTLSLGYLAISAVNVTSASSGYTSDSTWDASGGGGSGAAITANRATITLTGNTSIGGSGNMSIAPDISGAYTLTKVGAGTVTLSGSNSFTGALSVQAGTLAIGTINDSGANGVLGNSSNAVSLGNTGGVVGTLEYTGTSANSTKTFSLATSGTGAFQIDNSSVVLTISGIISGSGKLNKTGAGLLLLTGVNTYTGSTTISAGRLTIGADSGLGAAPGSATTGSLVLINGGTLGTSAGFTLSSNRGIALGTGTIRLTSGNLNYSGIIADQSGPGTLTITGDSSAVWVPGGASTYSGGTVLEATGYLVPTVNSSGSPGSLTSGPLGTGTLTIAGGSLRSTTGGARTIGNALLLTGDFVVPTVASETTLTLSGTATLTGNRNMYIGTGATVTTSSVILSGNIGDGGSGYSLTKSGPGILTLSGTNTFTGGITISAGTLSLGGTSALNATTPNTVTFGASAAAGTELKLGGNSVTVGGLVSNATPGTPVVENANASAATLTVSGSGSSTFAGVIQDGGGGGALSLTKSGTGTQVLTGVNTFTGAVTVTAGTLSVNAVSNASLSDGALGTSATGVTLGSTGGVTGTLEYTGLTASSNKPFTLATGGTGGFQIDSQTSNLTLSGIVSGAGALVKTGSGILTLSGVNTFTGPLNVSLGKLAVASVNNVSTSGALGNSATGVTLGSSGAIGTLEYTGATASSTKPFTLLTSGTGEFQIDTASTILTLSGAISGSGALIKSGPGTLKLSGAVGHLGTTTLSGGLLWITGTFPSNTPLVYNGGTILFDPSGTFSQSLGALNLLVGDTTAQSNRTSGNVSLTYSSLTRATGATGNFVISGGANGTTNSINITAQAGGFIDQGSFFGGQDYAFMNATGTYVRAPIYGTDANFTTVAGGASLTSNASVHYNITAPITAQTTGSLYTLRMVNATAANNAFTIASGNTLSVAGILKGGTNSGSVSGGTLQALTSGGELVFRSDVLGDSLSVSSVIQNNSTASSITKSGSGVLTLSGANTYTGSTYIAGGTLLISSDGNLGAVPGSVAATNIVLGGGVLAASTAVTLSANRGISLAMDSGLRADAGFFSLTGVIADSGILRSLTVMPGAGTMVFEGSSTYTGGTTLSPSSSTVVKVSTVGSPGSLTSGPFGVGVVTLAGGSLRATTTAGQTFGNAVTVSGDTTFNTTASEQTLTLSGPVTLTGNRVFTNEVGSTDNSQSLTISGAIGDSGSGYGLTIAGSGRLVLAGSNTFTGGLTINSGTVRLTNSSALNSVSPNSVTFGASVPSGTKLAVYGTSVTVSSLSTNATPGSPILENGSSTPSTVTVSSTSSPTYAGTIQDGTGGGSLGLTKSGTGTLTLSGSNSYTGLTTVSAGTLNLGSVYALGGGGSLTLAGGTIQLGVNGGTYVSEIVNSTSLMTFDSNSYSALFSGTIGASNTGGLTKVGAGTITLSGSNAYTGTTTILGGTLEVGATNALGTASALVFGDATANVGTLNATSFDQTVASLSLSSLLGNTTGRVLIGSGHTLTINGNVTIGATSPASTITSTFTMTGGGTLNVSSSGATFTVGGGSGTYGEIATLNLSGLDTLTANLGTTGTFRVGNSSGTNSGAYSTLSLPNTGNANTTITANLFDVGTGGQNTGAVVNSVTLGSGTTSLNVNTINIGSGNGRDAGSVTFAGANGTLVVRAADGSSRAAFNMGAGTTSTTGVASVGNTFNTSSHNVDLYLGAVTIGSQNRTDYGNTFTFDQGLLDMTSLTMSTRGATTGNSRKVNSRMTIAGGTVSIASGILQMGSVGAGSTGTSVVANGTLNVSGGSVSIGATSGIAILMGTANTGNIASGTLNITGGTVTLGGAIVRGGGAGTTLANVILNGGSLDMTAGIYAPIGDATNSVTLNGSSGFLMNVGTINGTGGLTKVTSGTLTLAGSNNYTGVTVIQTGTLALGSSAALSGGGSIQFSGGTLKLAADGATYSNMIANSGTSVIRLDSGGVDGTFSGNLVASNSAGLTKSGYGRATLSGSNSYTGVTTLSTGTLGLGSANALGGGGNITFAGGTLQFSASNTTDYASRIVSSTAGAIAIDTNGQDVTFANNLVNTNTGGLGKYGAGRLLLSGSNGYTGVTTIMAGTLALGSANALGGGGSVTFGGGTLQFTSSNTTDYSARITNSGSSIIVDTNAQGVTFAGSLVSSNSGGLTKLGAGTLTLSGSNSFTGVTTVNAGTLALGSSNALAGGGSLTFGGGTLRLGTGGATYNNAITSSGASVISVDSNTNSGTLSGNIYASNTGGFTKLGAGVLTLSGSNGFTGVTTVSAGTLALGNSNALAGGGSLTFGGGTLQLGTSGATFANAITSSGASVILLDSNANSGTWSGDIYADNTGGLTKLGVGVLTLSGSNGFTGITTLSAGTLALGSNNALAGGGSLTFGGGALQLGTSGATFTNAITSSGASVILLDSNTNNGTLSGNIYANNTGGLTKQGAGTITLSGSNGYTGVTTISAGTLTLGSANALAGGGSLTFGGGTLQLGTSGATYSNPIAGSGAFPIYLDSNANSGTLSGVIAAGQTGGVVKIGLGTVTLGAGQLHTASNTIMEGTLAVSAAANLGVGTGSSAIIFGASGGGTLQITGASFSSTKGATLSGTGTFDVVNAGSLSGVITGAGNLVKIGAGRFTISGSNNYTGVTVLQAGTLTLGSTNALAGGGSVTFAGGTLQLGTSGATFTNAITSSGASVISLDSNANNGTLSGNIYANNTGGLTKLGAGVVTLSGSNGYTGVTNINAGTLGLGSINALAGGGSLRFGGGTLQFTSGNTNDYAARITNSGSAIAVDTNAQGVVFGGSLDATNTGGLTKLGAGTLTLSGSNGFTGATTLSAGTLALGSSNALAGGGSLTFGGGTLQLGTSGATFTNAITSSGASVVLVDSNANNGTLSGNIDATNTGGFTKLGAGVVTLSGSNGFTGATTLSAGTLALGSSNALAGGGSLTFGGGTLQLGISGATFTNAITSSGASVILLDSSANSGTLSGNIYANNTGGLTKLGAGVVMLSGSNGYTGVTNINAGTLGLGSVNALAGGGSVTFGGGTLQLGTSGATFTNAITSSGASVLLLDSNANNGTLSGDIYANNTGGLTKLGAGVVTLSGSNGYTGVTNINAGTLGLGSVNALAGGGSVRFGGGTLQFTSGNTSDYAARITNSGSAIAVDTNAQGVVFAGNLDASNTGGLTKLGAGTLTLSGSNGFTGATTLSAGTLNLGSSNALAGGGDVTFVGGTLQLGTSGATYTNAITGSGASVILVDSNANTGTLSGNIDATNTGGLTKLGAGVVTLSGSNGFTGATTLSAGTLALGSSNALAGGGSVTFGGGTLQLGTNGATFTNGITGSGASVILLDSNANTGTLSGNIDATNTGGLTKLGAGVVTLSGSNGFTGVTTVSAGTLNLGSSNALAGGGSLTFAGGTLQLGTSGATFNNAITSSGAAAILLDSNTNTGTLSGAIYANNTGGFTKLGSGTVTLSGSNSFSGVTTVGNGVLQVAHGFALGGTADGTTVNSGAALELSGGITIGAEALTLSGTGLGGNGALRSISGNNTFGGVITLGAATSIQSDSGTLTLDVTSGNAVAGAFDLTLSGSGNITVSDPIATATGSLTKSGTGLLILAASNTFTGGLTINAGTVRLANSGALNSGTPNTVTFGSGVPVGTTLQLSGNDLTASGLATNATVGSPVIENGNATSGTLTVNQASGTSTFAGVMQDGTGGGSLSLVKSGSGTLALLGANTFTGVANVTAGTLQLVGAGALASGTISVGSGTTFDVSAVTGGTWNMVSGQTLSGAGTLSGTTTVVSGAKVVPYLSTGFGTLNTSSVTLNGEIRLRLGAGSAGDKLVVTGGLTLGGASTLVILDNSGANALGSLSSGTYELLTVSGAFVGTFGTFTQSATGGSQTLTYEANRVLLVATSSGVWTNGTANNLWDTAGNWGSGVVPGTVAGSRGLDTASFGSGVTAGTVTLATAKTQLKSLSFDSGNGTGYRLARSAGTEELWFYSSTGTATLSVSGGTHSIAVPIVLESDLGVTVSQGTSGLTVSAVINGTSGQALVKSGSGVLTLAASNTFTGGTRLNAGTIQVGNDGALGSGTLVLAGGKLSGDDAVTARTIPNAVSVTGDVALGDSVNSAALTFGGNVSLGGSYTLNVGSGVTFGGVISDGGNGYGFTKSGSGALVLGGVNTFTGPVSVSVGTLRAGSTSAFGVGVVLSLSNAAGVSVDLAGFNNTIGSLSGGGVLGGDVSLGAGVLTVGGDGSGTTYAGAITGLGGLTKTGTGRLTISGSNGFTGTTTLSAGTLALGGSNALAGGGSVTFGGGTLQLGTSGATFTNAITGSGVSAIVVDSSANSGTLSGNIYANNTGGLTKLGAGVVTLSGSNGFTGTTTLSAGTLTLGGSNALAGGGSLTFGGGTLQLGTSGATFTNAITGSGASAIVVDSSANSGTLSGNIHANNTGGFTKLGAGMVTLSGSNGFTGTTTLSAGTLALGSSNALAGGGSLRFGGGTLQLGTSGATFSNAITGSGASVITVDSSANSGTLSGVLDATNTGGFTKLGSGTVTLSGSNAYSGVTTVSQGVLRVLHTNGLGDTSSGTSVQNGAALEVSGGMTLQAEPLTLSGTGVANGGALRSVSGNNSWNGAITLAADSSIQSDAGTLTLSVGSGNALSGNFNVTLGGSGDVTVSKAIATSGGSVTKSGTGTLRLNASNTFTGGLVINGGTVVVGNSGALNSTSPNAVSFGSGVATDTRLVLNGNSLAVSGLDTNATPGSPVLENASASAAILSVSKASGSSLFAGIIRDGSGGGVLSLLKEGAGKLTLSGANTFTGDTSVNVGTLALSGAGAIVSGSIGVSSGATLDVSGVTGGWTLSATQTLSGAGTIVGSATVTAGAKLLPTLSGGLGTLTTGALSMNGELRLHLGESSVGEKLSVNGAVSLGASSLLTILDNAGANGLGSIGTGTYELLYASGGLTGTFGTFTRAVADVGTQSLVYDATHVYLTISTPYLGPVSGVWNGGASDRLWNTATNWVGGNVFGYVAPGTGTVSRGADTAVLGTSGVPSVITLSSTKTELNTLTFESATGTGYQLVGADTTKQLWFYGTNRMAAMTVNGGSHSVTLPVVIESDFKVTTTNAADVLSITGSISGTGAQSLTKTGSGVLVLAAANSYSGGTILNQGTVQVGNNGALGTGIVTVNGGKISGNDALTSRTVSNALSLAADLELGDAQNNGALNFSGGVTLTGSRSLTVWSPVTVSGVIDESGSGFGLTKNGPGALTLSGANLFSGGVTLNGGSLLLSGGNNRLREGGDLTLNDGELGLGGYSQSVGALTLNGGAISNGTLSASSYVASGGSVNGVLSGTGTFTKSGSGTVVLSGSNTYTGATTVSAGTLRLAGMGVTVASAVIGVESGRLELAGSGQLSETSAVEVTGGSLRFADGVSGAVTRVASLRVKDNGNVETGANTIVGVGNTLRLEGGTTTVNNGGRLEDHHLVVSGGTNVIQGGGAMVVSAGTGGLELIGGGSVLLTIEGGATPGVLSLSNDVNVTTTGGSARIASSGSGALNGRVDLNAGNRTVEVMASEVSRGLDVEASVVNGGLIKKGVGALVLWVANQLNRGVDLMQGVLEIAHDDALAGGGSLTFSGGTLRYGSGVSKDVSGSVASIGAGEAARIDTNGGWVDFASALSGAGSLVKEGAGTLRLLARSSYSGGSVVNAGTLILGTNGALNSSGAVTVSGGVLELGNTTQTVGVVTLTSGSITNGTLSGTRYDVSSGDIATQLAGTGALVKDTAGTVTITKKASYSGGTVVNAGTLRLLDEDVLLASGSVSVRGGTLVLDRTKQTVGETTIDGGRVQGGTLVASNISASSGIITSVISGTGSLVKVGAGTLIVSANNTFTGGTTINEGTLQLGNGGFTGLLGFGPIVNNSNLAFLYAQGAVIDIFNEITGSGKMLYWALDETVGYTVNFRGTNRSKGGMVLRDGVTLLVPEDAILGTGSEEALSAGVTLLGGTLRAESNPEISKRRTIGLSHFNEDGTGGGRFAIDAGAKMTVAGLLVDAESPATGDLIKYGSGELVLTNGSNRYTGRTIIEGGTVSVGDGVSNGKLGLGEVLFKAANTNLLIQATGEVDLNNKVTGPGTLVVDGNGKVRLLAENDYSATIIRTGTLQIGNGGGAGSLGIGPVENNALLTIQRKGEVNLSNEMTGSGTLRLAGSAGYTAAERLVVNLTRSVNLTGEVEVMDSTLHLSGTASVPVASKIKVQSGGVLDVSGVAGGYQINAGQKLGGNNGQVKGTILMSGTLAPGNSPGTLTLGGIQFSSGSKMEVEIDQGAGLFDSVVISGSLGGTGRAVLNGNGTVVVSPIGGLTHTGRYRILSAPEVEGQFAGVSGGTSVYKERLVYGGTSGAQYVDLELMYAKFQPYGVGRNGRALGGYLDRFAGGGSTEMKAFTDDLGLTATTAGIGFKMTEIGVNAYADTLSTSLQRMLDLGTSVGARLEMEGMEVVSGPGSGGVGSGATGWSGWTTTSVSSMTREPSFKDGFGGYHLDAQSSVVGVEMPLGPVRLGWVGATGSSRADFASPNARVKSDSWHMGLYGVAKLGRGYLDGLLMYGLVDNDAQRTIGLSGFARKMSAKFESEEFLLRLGGGLQVMPVDSAWEVGVNEHVSFAGVMQGAIEESHGGALGVRTKAAKSFGIVNELGLSVGRRFVVMKKPVLVKFRTNWVHDFREGGTLQAALSGAPSGAGMFDVQSARGDRDAVRINASVDIGLSERTTLRLGGEYEIRRSSRKGTLSISIGVEF